jgi:hypothetical protein
MSDRIDVAGLARTETELRRVEAEFSALMQAWPDTADDAAGWAVEAARLAVCAARLAGWWWVLDRRLPRNFPVVGGRDEVVRARLVCRDEARRWRDQAEHWRRIADQQSTRFDARDVTR